MSKVIAFSGSCNTITFNFCSSSMLCKLKKKTVEIQRSCAGIWKSKSLYVASPPNVWFAFADGM